MEQDIKVSVICCAYNHGPYIKEALEGFIKQKTNFAFEVLVHDDASTDNTAEIIKEYEEKYPDIIKAVYQKENQYSKGIKVVKTFLFPKVRGKYIAPCEGDDYWTDPLKLQKQYDFMEANPEYSLCACSTVWLNMQTNKSEKRCMITESREISLEEIILEKNGRIFQYGTVFAKADIFMNRPDWAYAFPAGDYALAIYSAISGKVYMLSDTMAVYRNHAKGSWTARMDNLEYRNKTINGMINALKVLNEATDHIYNDVILLRIKRHKYNLARANRDFKALKSEELKDMYYSKGIVGRLSDFLQCKCPFAYKFVIKILK